MELRTDSRFTQVVAQTYGNPVHSANPEPGIASLLHKVCAVAYQMRGVAGVHESCTGDPPTAGSHRPSSKRMVLQYILEILAGVES